jgi:hypothetical protein
MTKFLASFKALCAKSVIFLSVVCLLLLSNFFMPQHSYAASSAKQAQPKLETSTEEIIQPFELTKPEDSREGAYEEAAKLVENPKELIKAQNQEEKAQEKKIEK